MKDLYDLKTYFEDNLTDEEKYKCNFGGFAWGVYEELSGLRGAIFKDGYIFYYENEDMGRVHFYGPFNKEEAANAIGAMFGVPLPELKMTTVERMVLFDRVSYSVEGMNEAIKKLEEQSVRNA